MYINKCKILLPNKSHFLCKKKKLSGLTVLKSVIKTCFYPGLQISGAHFGFHLHRESELVFITKQVFNKQGLCLVFVVHDKY